MTISDLRFASELLTSKGRVYKFDDISCLLNFMKEDSKMLSAKPYVIAYNEPGKFIEADKAHYLHAEVIASPMGGNTAAFTDASVAGDYQQRFNARATNWQELQK